MPQLFITAVAYFIGEGLAATVIGNLLFMAASYLISDALKPTAQDSDLSNSTYSDRGQLINTESTSENLCLPYGRCRVGINRVFRDFSDTDNEYLHVVGTIGEGEIEGVVQVDGTDQIWLGDTLINDALFSGLVSYEIFTGTSNQDICTTLKTAIPTWDEYMPNTAYIYMKLKHDSNVFHGLPQITVLIDGVKVYNPSTGVTEYSNNPALCARDFIVRSSRRGGMGFSSSRLDESTFTAAATYCTAKGWTIGLPITEDQSASDNMSQILSCFRGALIYSGTLYKLKYKDLNYETSVMDVDESDVIFDGNNSTLRISQPSIFDTPNGINIKFLNSELNYQGDDLVLSDPELIDNDGGDYREETITIKGINSVTNAMKMAAYFLERMRYNKTAEFGAISKLLALEPLDLINFTHEIPGWVDKQLRVTGMGFNPEGNVQLNFVEEDESYYDDEYDVSEHEVPDTNIIKPSTPPPSVTDVTLTETLSAFRLRSFTRLNITFSPPASSTYPYWKWVKVWIRIGYSGVYKHITSVVDSYFIDPVTEGETYYIKLQSVNIWDTEENIDDTPEYSHTIVGVTDPPATLTNFTAVATNDLVTLMAPEPTNKNDIKCYEVRIGGNAWIGATFFGFYDSPIVRIGGVKPGTHLFWMSVLGTNELYSTTAKYATCTVFFPVGYGNPAANTWAWDFSLGLHQNTEKTTYGGDNALKCSHDNITGSNLIVNGDFDSVITSWTATGSETSEFDASGLIGGSLKITASASNVGDYQDITVEAEHDYRLKFHYKNTAGDLASYRIYDQTNGVDIVATTNLADSTDWGSEQVIDFETPVDCTTVRIYLYSVANGDVVWFDEVECYEKTSLPNLTGKWLSPEYDLSSVKTVRVWGDFLTTFIGAGNTWDAIFPSPSIWDTITPDGTTWNQLNAIEAIAAVLSAKIYWGNTSGALDNEADYFQILALEFSAQYIQVEITIVDNATGSQLYLKTLNMSAAERV
jgi:hypothetical protein